MIRCVIFDMDGVVVDTEPLSHAAGTAMYKSLNITVPDDVYATFIGNSDRAIVRKLKNLYDIKLTEDELLALKYRFFFEAFDKSESLNLIHGVKALIEELYQKGIKLVLASSSSKKKIVKVFDRFGLHSFFSDFVSGEDFEESKPHPAIFNEAVARSGFAKDECIVIEDSTNGIRAAKAAGLYCIAYKGTTGLPQDVSGADRVIIDFGDLEIGQLLLL